MIIIFIIIMISIMIIVIVIYIYTYDNVRMLYMLLISFIHSSACLPAEPS